MYGCYSNHWSCDALSCDLVDFATVVGFLVLCRPFLNLSHPRYLNATHNEILMVNYYIILLYYQVEIFECTNFAKYSPFVA